MQQNQLQLVQQSRDDCTHVRSRKLLKHGQTLILLKHFIIYMQAANAWPMVVDALEYNTTVCSSIRTSNLEGLQCVWQGP